MASFNNPMGGMAGAGGLGLGLAAAMMMEEERQQNRQYNNQYGNGQNQQYGNQPNQQYGNPSNQQYNNQVTPAYGNQPGNQQFSSQLPNPQTQPFGSQFGNQQYSNSQNQSFGSQFGNQQYNNPQNQSFGSQFGNQQYQQGNNQYGNSQNQQYGSQVTPPYGNQPGNQQFSSQLPNPQTQPFGSQFGNQQNNNQYGNNQNQQPQPLQQNTAPKTKAPKLPSGGNQCIAGQKISLGANITKLKIGLNWEVRDPRCDLDASAFLLNASRKVPGDEWFVFYGQDCSPDGSTRYHGYDIGGGELFLDLTKVRQDIERIAVAVTIDEAVTKRLNFSMVNSVRCALINPLNNQVLAAFDLTDCSPIVTALVVGEVYRYKNEWKFNAVGSGVSRDLAGFCGMYGVNLV